MSRSQRASWTFSLSLIASVSTAIAALLTTPVLLHYLGDERVGAYRVAIEWTGYLALLDFGVTGALQVAFAKSLGAGDRAGVAAAVRAGLRAGLILAVIYGAFGLGLVVGAPYMLRGMSVETSTELRLGLLVSLVAVLWVPLIVFRPLAEAGQRGYIVQFALIVQCWLTTGLVIAAAAAGTGLPGQFLVVAVGNGISLLILIWDTLRRYPEILARTAAAVALPIAFSGSMFVYNLLGRIGLLSDSIILGFTLGPTAVVSFVVSQRLLLLADTQVMALGSASWGALAELHHRGEQDLFNLRLTQLTRWTGVFGFALLVPLTSATKPFVDLWVGAGRYGGDLLVIATAGYVWVHTITALWGWPLVTTGRVRALLPLYFVGVPLNIAISVIASLSIGVAGPALGSMISLTLVWLWWLPRVLRREFRIPLRPLARSVVGPAFLGLPLSVGLYIASSYFPVNELAVPLWSRWFILAAVMAVAAVAYCVLAWFLVLPREDRHELRARIFRR